jgi:4-alpha-glucanotransferase
VSAGAGDAVAAPEAAAGPAHRRAAGLLLHPTSLPGAGPIGDLGPAAHALLDWLVEAGLSHWQVLPLGPTGYADSPYTALSSFAGNPLLVSPEQLAAAGLAASDDFHFSARENPTDAAISAVDFAAAHEGKKSIHRRVWESFAAAASAEISLRWRAFRDDLAVRPWLAEWAEYAALKERHGGRPWLEWDRELRDREPGALARARHELAGEIEFHAFEQFLFDCNGERYARRRARAASG